MIRQTHTNFAAYPEAAARGARLCAGLLMLGFLAVGLSGCGGSDAGVSLNGKIFDLAGLTGGAKGAEPKLAERAPLVPPPRTDALPQPGTERADAGHMAWPDDPDKKRMATAKAAKQYNDKYCTDPMLNRPEIEVAQRDAECRAQNGGLLTSATSWFSSTKEAKPGLATDEGDPGIVTGSTKPAPASAAKTR